MIRAAAHWPLAVFGIAAAIALGFNWQSALVLLLSGVCAVAVAACAYFFLDVPTLFQVFHHADQYRGYTFREVPFERYREIYRQLLRQPPTAKVLLDNVTGTELGKDVRILIAVPPPGTSRRMSSQVAHSTHRRTWITLTCDPAGMRPMQHFQVLHELGHSTYLCRAMASVDPVALLILQLSAVPIFFWLSEVSVLSMSLLGLYLLAVFAGALATRAASRYKWLYDELCADYYAVSQSARDWFAKFPVKKASTLLASEVPPALKKPFMSADSQRRYRQIFLARNIKRGLQGKKLLKPYLPDAVMRGMRLTNRCGYVVTACALALGLFCTSMPSRSGLVVFSITAGVMLILAAAVNYISGAISDIIDGAIAGREPSERAVEVLSMVRDRKRGGA